MKPINACNRYKSPRNSMLILPAACPAIPPRKLSTSGLTTMITTVFEPNSACFAPSNLWLSSVDCYVEYGASSPEPDATLTSLTCPVTLLGPPKTYGVVESSCYQWVDLDLPATAFSDCPVGMTAAVTSTRVLRSVDGIKIVATYCCPS